MFSHHSEYAHHGKYRMCQCGCRDDVFSAIMLMSVSMLAITEFKAADMRQTGVLSLLSAISGEMPCHPLAVDQGQASSWT